MNILVTVGTTPFHSLVKAVSRIDNEVNLNEKVNFTFQVAELLDEYKGDSYVSYLDNINEFYLKSDIIITHAGAGSIYTLLDLQSKIVVVPNLERMDKHQTEMAEFVERNDYGSVCLDSKEISLDYLLSIREMSFKRFCKDDFFLREEIFKGL
ncbi:PssE/Cps14G family polysaccharide biosynthesis glycosyltransferase [Vibrio cyclitrophicus]